MKNHSSAGIRTSEKFSTQEAGALPVAWRESELQAWIEVKVLASRIGRVCDMPEFIILLTKPQSPTSNHVPGV